MNNKINNNLGYFGIVDIKVVDNNGKIISNKTIHNRGRWPLFYFLSNCIIGNYSIASAWRPIYIKLYKVGDSGDSIPTINDVTGNKIETVSEGWEEVSDYIVTNRASNLIKNEQNENGATQTSIKFLIPATRLHFPDDVDNPVINGCVLYSNESNEDISKCSAFCFITNDEGTKLSNLLDENDIELLVSNINEYNIEIDWRLGFTNNLTQEEVSS